MLCYVMLDEIPVVSHSFSEQITAGIQANVMLCLVWDALTGLTEVTTNTTDTTNCN